MSGIDEARRSNWEMKAAGPGLENDAVDGTAIAMREYENLAASIFKRQAAS